MLQLILRKKSWLYKLNSAVPERVFCDDGDGNLRYLRQEIPRSFELPLSARKALHSGITEFVIYVIRTTTKN